MHILRETMFKIGMMHIFKEKMSKIERLIFFFFGYIQLHPLLKKIKLAPPLSMIVLYKNDVTLNTIYHFISCEIYYFNRIFILSFFPIFWVGHDFKSTIKDSL